MELSYSPTRFAGRGFTQFIGRDRAYIIRAASKTLSATKRSRRRNRRKLKELNQKL